jgi:hypothetical protein
MSRTNHRLIGNALISALFIILLAGCSSLNFGHGSDKTEGPEPSQSYFPTKFHDFEVPNELKLDRDTTLIINTSSFTGGIVSLTGRLEVDSLTDFFNQSMQKNGWKLMGEAHYKNVLLAFTKPNKTCMITIYEGQYGASTKVHAYMTEDLTAGGGGN